MSGTSRYRYYRLAGALNAALPARVCVWLAERFGEGQWRKSARDRSAVQANLALITGRRIEPFGPEVREVFRNFGRYLLEFLNVDRLALSDVTIDGAPAAMAALKSDQGAVILSAHVGNWELGAVALSRLGHRFAVVALPHTDPRVNAWFNVRRQAAGIEVVAPGPGATGRCVSLLRDGVLLGVVGDREFGFGGIEVSLFGRRVRIPRGPALLSLRCGVPAIPTFVIRESFGRFRLFLEPPIRPETGPGGMKALAQQYADVIERYLRRFPEQWLMFRELGSELASQNEITNDQIPITI
ncbi:MAG: lysophospholipid acyltransferase family protein [Candidatus Omnitrophica bacterium]|nr:lysophospholipid acyltransferase family protein [Candidatus Omnitrophota bacterium]